VASFSDVLALPDVNFVSTAVNDLLSAGITAYQNTYQQLTGQSITVQPGDDVYILLYAEALRQYSILQSINLAARQNLLKYATNGNLDVLAANSGNERLTSQAAITSETFTLGVIQATPISVPILQGTRVTAGDGIYFATDAAAVIPGGSLSVTVPVTCTVTGSVGNGYIPGQLDILVDSVPYVASVSNTTTTQGGSDLQSDLSLAETVFASPSGYSVAGPASAYDYFTRKFSSDVIDTNPTSPSACVVDLYVLLSGGTLPQSTFLSELAAYLEPYRPMTDQLTCLAPTVTNYTIAGTYYIDPSNASQAATIQSAVQLAISAFITWTQSKIGRDIIPDMLTTMMVNAGAKRFPLTSPAFTSVSPTAIAVALTPATPLVIYGGLDAS
jgi:phage-related baseplate assembly protein